MNYTLNALILFVQLSQVQQAIQAAGLTPDLEALQKDLQDLIKLTEGKKLIKKTSY